MLEMKKINKFRLKLAAFAAAVLMCVTPSLLQAQTIEDGTIDHPFLIESLEELKAFRDGVNSTAAFGFFFYEGSYITDTATTHITGAVGIPRGGEGTYFKLTTDIVVNVGNVGGCDGTPESGWEQWEPIGWHAEASQAFNGHFDGDFHVISGIYIKGGETKGFFGSVVDGEVKNLAITNSYIHANRIAGGISAWNTASTISHCWSSATIVADRGRAGGIVGYNTSSVAVLATVEYCYNAGLVRAFSLYAGGIVGENFGGAVRHCYNSNSVLGDDDYCGAITGSNEEGGTVDSCYYDNLFSYIARDGATAAPTNLMTTNAVAAVLGTGYTYTTGLYPQLTGFTSSTAATASRFSALPIQLPTSSDANGDNGVNGNITLSTTVPGILWASSNPRASVSGTTVALSAKGDFRLMAYLESYNCAKQWYLNSRVGQAQGTEANPFSIDNASAFATFRDLINTGNGFEWNGDPVNAGGENQYFVLTNDIDLNPEYSNDFIFWTDDAVPTGVTPWTSLGTPEAPFKGNFSGEGHTVAGIYGESLFGVIENATVKKLGIIRGRISSSKQLGYATDGLIMHYDGILNTRDGHDANATQWEDLAGNYHLTPHTYESLEWGADHILLKGDSAYLASGMEQAFLNSIRSSEQNAQSPQTNGGSSNITIEIVTKIDQSLQSPTQRGLVGSTSNSSYLAGEFNNTFTAVGGIDITEVNGEVATLTWSRNVGSFLNGSYKNGNFLPVPYNEASLVFGNSYLASYHGLRGWNDSIYAIRVYSRALTSAEIRRNAEIDRLRFVQKEGGGYSGTLVNANFGGTVTECFSTCDIDGGAGLVGYNTGIVSNSVYAGNATGSLSAGLVAHSTGTVSACALYGTLESSIVVDGSASDVTFDNALAPFAVSTTGITGKSTANMLTDGHYPLPAAFGSSASALSISTPVALTGDAFSATAITITDCEHLRYNVPLNLEVDNSTCEVTLQGVGSSYVAVGDANNIYKVVRLTLGSASELTVHITDKNNFLAFRNCINTGEDFYYDPEGKTFSTTTDATHTSRIKRGGEGTLFVLDGDIDFDGVTSFEPIGIRKVSSAKINFLANPFKGTFDGQGHVIKNFTVADSYYYALFAYSQGVIRNLGIEKGEIKGNKGWRAALVFANNGTVENCHVSEVKMKDNKFSGAQRISMLVGVNLGGVVENCYVSKDTVSLDTTSSNGIRWYYSGLLVGTSFSGCIRNCYVEACHIENKSRAEHYAGMLLGVARFTEIENCRVSHSSFAVTSWDNTASTTGYVGLLAGAVNASKIKNCYTEYSLLDCPNLRGVGGLAGTAAFSLLDHCFTRHDTIHGGMGLVGGLLGSAHGSDLYYCYNHSDITCFGSQYSVAGNGGLVGTIYAAWYHNTIDHCYNAGNIEGAFPDNYTLTGTDRRHYYNSVSLGGLVGTIYHNASTVSYGYELSAYRVNVLHSFNSGNIRHKGNVMNFSQGFAVAGLVAYDYNNRGQGYTNIDGCFNVGCVDGGNVYAYGLFGQNVQTKAEASNYNAGRVTGNGYVYATGPYSKTLGGQRHYDRQMSGGDVDMEFDSEVGRNNDYKRDTMMNTADMLGNGLKGRLGNDDHWVFTSGMYPRIKGLENEPASIAAATPVLLYTDASVRDDIENTDHNFSTGSTATWRVLEGSGLVTASGNDYALNSGARGTVLLGTYVGDTLYKTVRLFIGLDVPFKIKNLTELEKFRDGINSKEPFYYDPAQDTFALAEQTGVSYITVPAEGDAAHFLLTANITMPDTSWTPIGFGTAVFKGSFDGGNHTISDLKFSDDSQVRTYAGFFGKVGKGSIRRVHLVNPSISATAEESVVGGIAAQSGGCIDSCSVMGGLIEGRIVAGGICGVHEAIAWSGEGGSAWYDTTHQVLRCWNVAEVAGSRYAGGIVGYEYTSVITECYNQGEVRARNIDDVACRTGGIAGYSANSIRACYNMGVVRGSKMSSSYTGGIVGEFAGGIVHYSYNTGEIIGNKSICTGGIVGYRGSTSPSNIAQYCYNAGRVSGNDHTGTINGTRYLHSNGNTYIATESYAYYDNQMCPAAKVENGTAKSTVEMVGSNLQTGTYGLGSTYYEYRDSLYPQLKCFLGTAASAASVTPLFLRSGENVTAVAHDFHAKTDSVTWTRVSGGGVYMDGDTVRLDGNIGIATLQNHVSGKDYREVRLFLMSDENPLIIRNVTQLDTFRTAINSSAVFYYKFADSTFTMMDKTGEPGYLEIPAGGEEIYFRLNDTIFDLADLSDYPNWTPIGTEERPFSGHFNGHNIPIKHLSINSNNSYLGLFGNSDGSIDSVKLVAPSITSGDGQYVGAVVGYTIGSVTACETYQGSVTSTGDYLGGLVGCSNGGILINCAHRHGEVTRASGNKKDFTGGVVGYIYGAKMVGCHNDTSTVTGYRYVGGVAGYAYPVNTAYDSINYCYTIGGIVQDNLSDYTNASNYIGGVIGLLYQGNVLRCYNEKTSVNTHVNYVAGLVGGSSTTATIKYCYNTGNVEGRAFVGGISCVNQYNSTFEFLFNKGDVTADYGCAMGMGYYVGTLRNCMNAGNITSGTTTKEAYGIARDICYSINRTINMGRITARGADGIADGICQYKEYYENTNANYVFKDCMNAGEIISLNGKASGLVDRLVYPKNCINVGRVNGLTSSASISNGWDSENSFYDVQMSPSITYRAASNAYTTNEMIGTALQTSLEDDHWIYEAGMYPRLKWTDTVSMPYMREAAIVASTPVFFSTTPEEEHVNSATEDFTLGGNTHQVKWRVENGNGLNVSGYNVTTNPVGIVYLRASLQAGPNTQDSVYKSMRIVVTSDLYPIPIKNKQQLLNFRNGVNNINAANEAIPFYYNTADSTFSITEPAGGIASNPTWFEIPAGGEGVHFKLLCNVDLSDQGNWTPIGNYTSNYTMRKFRGYFDGGNHIIENMKLSDNRDYKGFFGYAAGAEIQNLYMKNVKISSNSTTNANNQYAGAVCAYAQSSTISGCRADGTIYGHNIGGIVGYCYDGLVERCYNVVNLTYNSYLSGLPTSVGGITAFGTVQDCYNVGNINGNNAAYTGGIVGNGDATRCYNLGTVKANTASYSISGTDLCTNCFNDSQMVPSQSGGTNKLTTAMTATALQSAFGTDGTWVYADDMYPRLAGLDTSSQAVVYATPVYLHGTQNVNTVRSHFNVGHAEDVVWSRYGTGTSLDLTDLNVASSAVDYNCLVMDCGEDTLQVTKNDVTRLIPITIYVDRLEVTTFVAYTCGEPYFWNVSNKYYTRTGTFTETFATQSGCDSVVSLQLTVPVRLSGSISPIQISCFGEEDAELTAYINGGFGEGYLYKWINGSDDTLNIAPAMSPENLDLNPLITGAGTYHVLVIDALHNECQYETDPVTIVEPSKLVTTLVDYGTICEGTGNATANRYITLRLAGGRAPYTISYTVNGNTTNRTVPAAEAADGDIVLNYLNVGEYTVSVHDNGTYGHSPCDTTYDPIVFDGDPNVYTVTAASYSDKYDGAFHDARYYSVASNGSVIAGAENVPSTEGFVLNRTATYKDSLIVTMTGNESYAGVYAKDAGHYDNTITECSVQRIYSDGITPNEEVRCRYNINLVNGSVDITKRELTLTSASAVEVYTGGGALTAETVTRTGDEWATGEEPNYTDYAELTGIGSTSNTFTINYVTGVNYDDNYIIHVVNGTLTYLGSSEDVVFTAPTLQKTYDGKEWTVDTVATRTTTNLDLTTYRYELTVNENSHIKNVGTATSKIDAVRIYNRATNEEVTNTTFDGHVVKVDGTLTITTVNISLSSSSASQIYNGDTLTRPTVTMTGSFVEGEVSAAPEATGKIAGVGDSVNRIDYHPVAGVFIPANYSITLNQGHLRITPRDVSFTGEGLTTEYMGDTIRLTTITAVNMVDGHTLSGLTYLAKGKDKGEYPGVFAGTDDFQILDAQGHNVKSNYNVTDIMPGLLKITANNKNIVIASKSGSTIYTGSNFRKDEYTVTYDGLDMPFISSTQFILSTGDTLTFTSTAVSVKHVLDNAPNNNTFEYSLSGRNSNYMGAIDTIFGTLEISPRPLNLKSDNGEKVYDGSALTATTIVEQASSYGFAVGEGFEYYNFAAPVNVGNYTNSFEYRAMAGTDTRVDDYIVDIAYGTLKITKATCTITPDAVTRQYGESNPTTWEYTITDYALNDSEEDLKDTLTDKGQPIISTTATAFSVPGTYPITIDPNHLDLWNYDVTLEEGVLTIDPLALVLKANGDTVMYDGNNHSVSGFTVEYNGNVYTSVDGVATITVADTAYHITATTANPTDKRDAATYANSFSGTPVVTRADDETAVRTSWFNITTRDSVLVILPDTTKIYVTSYDQEWTYDGLAHNYTRYTVKRGTQTYEIADGDVAEVTLATGDKLTISNPGSVTNVSDNAANNNTFTVTLENSTNYVSGMIEKTMGTLTITPAEVTLTANDSTKVYDATALTQPRFTASALAATDDHTFTVVMTAASTITNVGTQTNEIATVDGTAITTTGTPQVIGNYKVTTATGTLEITPMEVTLTANDSTKVYDATALTQPRFTASALAATDDHTFTVVMTAASTITNVGTQTNEIATVDGTAITTTGTPQVIGNYKVTTATGTLEVTPATITIKADDKTKMYDNDASTDPALTATITGVPAGGTEPMYSLSREAGQNVGDYTITVTAESSSNPNYVVATETGTFTITPRTGVVVTIQEHGKEVEYNGTDQRVTGYGVSIADPINLYTTDDFSFTGQNSDSIAHGTGAESALTIYDMNLRREYFRNDNANYTDVTFNILDSALYIYPKLKAEVTATTDIYCHGGNNGTAEITVTGGKPNNGKYSFALGTNPAEEFTSPHTFEGLSEGDYEVVVTDSLNYTVAVTFHVDELPELTATIVTPTDLCPNQGNYPVSVTVNGGTAPYTYTWTGAQDVDAAATGVVQTEVNDGETTYTVSVSILDAHNCPVEANATFTVKPSVSKPGSITYTCANDTTVTLRYGAVDTAIVLNQPTYTTHFSLPMSVELSANGLRTRYAVPEGREDTVYIVTWKVTDECGDDTVICSQRVTVKYPVCGPVTDAGGFSYFAVRLGGNCWTASNMMITPTPLSRAVSYNGAYKYNDDDELYQKFGYLYTWYAACHVPEGSSDVPAAADAYGHIQGICPDDWALPTAEDYIYMVEAIGGVPHMKIADSDFWVDGMEGTTPSSGFDAKGAGYYKSSTNSFEGLMTVARFWTATLTGSSDTGTAVQCGVCEGEEIIVAPKADGYSIRCVRIR